ncbi:MAG: EF-P lysine aminoacylase GenX [Myxococcales bacterium]|nr:EF-P lysine aminoacylase GenX [Myxococcales bacterium]
MTDGTLARVLAVGQGLARLWIAGRVFDHPSSDDLQAGDIIRLSPDGLTLVVRPQRPPSAGGDLARLSADQGLRYRAVLERAALLRAIRDYFHNQGFTEIDAPVMATCPGLELHLDAVSASVREGMGGKMTERWLSTSPEFHMKRLIAAGFDRIFSLGKAFRSGERGVWHNPEFAMLEWYRTDERYPAIVEDILALLPLCTQAVDAVRTSRGQSPCAPFASEPTLRLTFAEALGRWAGFDIRDADLPTLHARAVAAGLGARDGDDEADLLLQAMVERVEPNLPKDRVVVIDRWPQCLASLARRDPEHPGLAERFEVYIRGIELANGFTELVDAAEQRQRFEADVAARREADLPIYPVDERFLGALAEGCPPAAGVALGVDRLLMVIGGYDDIEQVLAFPFERA